ncbi:aminotransferase class V-fold PLP-dependent enzyme [Alteromonas sp. 1_MG-2023]|uniref:aminotransferase class V-fold PLP-dependent enzyme n=1 Tax=Alteromonas sp. 1_MG-2023 TaxID=3062669 RepID=UPI0026E11597|nr:aminotransferase class V-fold PLP-dependent enzyme [Alteromonas sp. 1_MG-2023]MDO6474054.1 aminotransferase class V-fold PLP-dependent enzyme [Alteromonas sp. 1_MG-2023]
MSSRRQFLKYSAVFAASSTALSLSAQQLESPVGSAATVARDEHFWHAVRSQFDVQNDIINLEQGYWGKMANPVQQAFFEHTKKVNHAMSWYVRKQYKADFLAARESVADALKVKTHEIMLTRNATESFVNLITQFNDFKAGDEILWADIDYPAYQDMMVWLSDSRNVKGHELSLPASGTDDDYIDVYRKAFERNPRIKLMLLTHVSNQHGLVMPVKRIAQLAREHGIYVICDTAQSWGLLDFTPDELGVDWATFNLHKWIGSPVGVGALYMREQTLAPVMPFPGEDPGDNDVANRVHLATSDFASFLSVPDALAFHHKIGGKNKEARLRYLWESWTLPLRENPEVEILGAASSDNASGMGGFRLKGKTSPEENQVLQKRLEEDFGIFTVVRNDLSSGSNIRVTPQIFTPVAHMQKLAEAITTIAG